MRKVTFLTSTFFLCLVFTVSAQSYLPSKYKHKLVNLRVLQGVELLSTTNGIGEAKMIPASLDSYDLVINFQEHNIVIRNYSVVKTSEFQGMIMKEIQGEDKTLKATLVYDMNNQLTMIHVKDQLTRTFATDKLPPLPKGH
ncbi:MAG: hypothetical protein NZ521_00420 [Flammeovirgaceae bacterium]|nr:hypothetical protein [Flammeovirgaceae bacterium]MDW8286550.1 hypothetical protein [Flammeovirgaceae bacterium]